MVPVVEVAVRLRNGKHAPVCVDCSQYFSGKRFKLTRKQRGRPCPVCEEMEHDEEQTRRREAEAQS